MLLRRIPGHLLVAASAWGSRVVTAITGLLSIRLLLKSLGEEHYALFAVLSGLQGWYMLTDAGLGVSLQNYISELRARDRAYDSYVSATIMIMLLLVSFNVLVLYLISPWLSDFVLKSFPTIGGNEKIQAFFWVGILLMLSCFGGVVYKIWYAEQKGYLANIVPAVAAIISLIGLVAVEYFELENKLLWNIIAMFFPQALFPLLVLLKQSCTNYSVWQHIQIEIVVNLLKRAGKFFFFSIMAAGVLQIDYIMMSQFLQPHDIIIYNLATKIFSLVFFVYSAILSALWPVCSEAIALNKWENVNKYLQKYICIGIGIVIFATIILLFIMPEVIHVISPQKNYTIPVLFVILLGAYYIIRVWTDSMATVLMSMSYLKPLWVFVPVQALFSALLQWILIPRLGIYGVVIGISGSFLLTVTWGLPLAYFRQARFHLGKQQPIAENV